MTALQYTKWQCTWSPVLC